MPLTAKVYQFNPLAAEFLLLPFIGHRVNCLQTFTWHWFSFSMFTVFTDFFLWYSCFPGWELKLLSHPQYKVSVYTLSKAENQKIQFPLLCIKPSKDKQVFFFQRLVVPGPIYRPPMPCEHYQFLASNKIFGFSPLALNKIWPSTFPPTTDRIILFAEKNIGHM